MSTDRIYSRLEVKFVSSAPDVAEGTFSGYGARFGNVDSYGDVIAPGAFKSTLKSWKKQDRLPPMLLQHAGGLFGGGAMDMVPIGVWDEMSEDESGLLVKGHLLALDTDRGKGIYEAMKAGALDGMSIGYIARTVKFGKGPDEPARTLQAIDLVEVSVVTFPANPEARVDSVKSGMDMTERDFEHFLRDAGFTREQSKTIVAKGYRLTRRDAMPSEDTSSDIAALNALAAKFREQTHGTRSQDRS